MKDYDKAVQRLREEALYSRVVEEMEAGVYAKGLWGKALADCHGDEKLALSLYLKYRVTSLIDERKYAQNWRQGKEEDVRLKTAVQYLKSSGFIVDQLSDRSWKVVRPDGKLARYFYSVDDIFSFSLFVKKGGSI